MVSRAAAGHTFQRQLRYCSISKKSRHGLCSPILLAFVSSPELFQLFGLLPLVSRNQLGQSALPAYNMAQQNYSALALHAIVSSCNGHKITYLSKARFNSLVYGVGCIQTCRNLANFLLKTMNLVNLVLNQILIQFDSSFCRLDKFA